MPEDPDTPPLAGGAKGLWIKPETYQSLRRAALRKVIPDPQDFTVTEQNGNTHFRLRGGATAGGNLNLHIRKQTEESIDGFVNDNLYVKTLCFRDGLFVGSIDQADPDNLTEVLESHEESAPEDLISKTVTDIDPIPPAP